MPLRPTRPAFPLQASPTAVGRRPAMPAQAAPRPVPPVPAKKPLTLPDGKARSAQANALGKQTAAAAKAGTLTGAGQAAAAKTRKGAIGPANPPKRTPVTHRGKGFSIREPRQRGGS